MYMTLAFTLQTRFILNLCLGACRLRTKSPFPFITLCVITVSRHTCSSATVV